MRNFKQLQNPDKDTTKQEFGKGRKSVVKQPKGHPASKRNQAYGGESEEQYNPPKYKAIKQELKDSGGKGHVNVPSKPPYKQNPLKQADVIRGKEHMDKVNPNDPDTRKAITNLQKKALEKTLKKKIKRPKTSMPKHNTDGTMKK